MLSTQTKVGISTLGAGSLAVLLGRAFPIEDYLYFTSHLLNLVLMILVLCIVVGLRIWLSTRKIETGMMASKKAKRIYCRPVRFRLLLKNLLLVTLALFLSSVTFYFVLSTSKPNLISHVALFAFSLVFLSHGNLLLYASGEDYKAKVKK